MMKHSYFGQIEKAWAGFSSEHKIKLPYFEAEVEVFLGEEFDEEGEEIETPPTDQQIAEFEQTLKAFLSNIQIIITDIQQSAFDYYNSWYAEYYEKPFEVIFENNNIQKTENDKLHPPLNIDTKEKHFEYMKDMLGWIRILNGKAIKIPIRYALDEEHGLELKIINNKVAAVDGIAET
jgi:hypothetical protein